MKFNVFIYIYILFFIFSMSIYTSSIIKNKSYIWFLIKIREKLRCILSNLIAKKNDLKNDDDFKTFLNYAEDLKNNLEKRKHILNSLL